jgi:ABC-type phosphate transport system auxiliary subunit
MELKTLAELDELHDELVKKSAALQQEFAVLQQRIDALRAAQRKPSRAKK